MRQGCGHMCTHTAPTRPRIDHAVLEREPDRDAQRDEPKEKKEEVGQREAVLILLRRVVPHATSIRVAGLFRHETRGATLTPDAGLRTVCLGVRFEHVSVVLKPESAAYIKDWMPGLSCNL